MSSELRQFIDRVIVPTLLERFLREQRATGSGAVDGPQPSAIPSGPGRRAFRAGAGEDVSDPELIRVGDGGEMLKLEVFAREKVDGWASWGDQIGTTRS